MSQEQIFLKGEGDAWFRRNRNLLCENDRFDWPLTLLSQLDTKPASVFEFGCANGWRLARLRGLASRLVGIDASAEAISQGRRAFPELELRQGLVADVDRSETFDCVIVNYVLHWIDRSALARSIATIDEVLVDGGVLIVGDFLPDHPQRRRYHHRPDDDVWTWKQDYSAIFESLGTYKLITRVAYDHDRADQRIGRTDGSSRGVCNVLVKRLSEFYSQQ